MVPYAQWVDGPNGFNYKECPMCGLVIECKERKDFESYSGIEYARHVEAEHPEKVIRIGEH